MQFPGYNSGEIKFSEGEWYPFKIHNLVKLQDNAYYYIFQDINGLKHFVPAEPYTGYGFRTGEEIMCKIDRINCTGRIFLEPKHPYYNEGESYIFDVTGYSNESPNQLLIVKEMMGNSIEVPVCNVEQSELSTIKRINCKVKYIKKSIPILEFLHYCT